MKNKVINLAEKEILVAIIADQEANNQYYHLLKRFAAGESSEIGEKLDTEGLKKINTAWIKLDQTNKCLRRAYMRLYSASL